MWTMRLRRTGCGDGQRAAARPALPTAAAFHHMPTAFDPIASDRIHSKIIWLGLLGDVSTSAMSVSN